MKTSQQQRQSQQLSMTPQLLQQIRLLQLSRVELEQELQQALDTNLALEVVEESLNDIDADAEETVEVSEYDEIEAVFDETWGEPAQTTPDDYDPYAQISADDGDLHSRMRDSIYQEFRDPRDQMLARALAESTDDCGYLSGDLNSLFSRLCHEFGINLREIERVLHKLQRLDPAGFAARNLGECLLAQLDVLPRHTPNLVLAMRIVSEALDLLAAHDHDALAQRYNVNTAQVAVAERLILSLNPRPADLTTPAAEVIHPDVVVRRQGREWRVDMVGRGLPRLRVNPEYERLLSQCSSDSKSQNLRDQMNEARWIVRGLEMRNDTLLRAARVIFARQRGFLEMGEEGLAPLTLHEVADAIGMHESTICRITQNKFVQTPRGVFELKVFFSNPLSRTDGSEISGAAVRAMVRRLIEREDPSRPLADGLIAKMLERKGVVIARRTVAKYREALDIAPAKMRQRNTVSQPTGVFA